MINASSRAERLALGLGGGMLALVLGAVLVRVLGFNATRATAVGVSAATLAMVTSGGVMGVVARGRRRVTPWLSVVVAAAFLAGVQAIALNVLEVRALLYGDGTPSFSHGLTLAGAIGAPALVLMGLGAMLGAHTEKRWTLGCAAGAVVLYAIQIVASVIAPSLSYDGDIVALIIGGATLVSFLAAGVAISWMVRRLGFVEIWVVALFYGYSLFLLIGRFGEVLLTQANIPEQQIMVALSIVPTGMAVALLSVGASVGFLLFGGGRLDPHFGVELMLGLRYLKLRRPRLGTVVVVAALWLIVGSVTRSVAVMTSVSIPLLLILVVLALGLRGSAATPKSDRRSPFVGVTLVISVAGVCLGVMALIVVLSVMGGFEDDIKSKILGAHAHVAVTKKGDDFSEYAAVEQRLGKIPGVHSSVAFVLAEGMISSEVGLSGTLVKGVDPLNPGAIEDLAKNIESGHIDDLLHPERIAGAKKGARLEPDSGAETSSGTAGARDFASPIVSADLGLPTKIVPAIVIGREMARTLRARVGDTVNLVSPASEELGPTGPAPKLRRFRVAAIFYSGMYEFDSKFSYLEMKQAQRFFGLNGRATGVELRVDDLSQTQAIASEVKRLVGGHPFAVRDWREMNKELFSALLLEKIAMFIVLTFIVLVASFLIVSTLVMIVLEKAREIAILKSMGASSASLMKVFVVQGLIVGFGGSMLGLILGVAICLIVQRFGLDLDPDVFYITRLPVVMDGAEIGAVVSCAVIITYLASIYPAMAAAALNPVEGLRDD